MRHDTAQIRSVARKVQKCADTVSDVNQGEVTALRRRIPGEFQGSAAETLMEKLEELGGDLRKISAGLETISGELMAYARRLELADQESKRVIDQK